MFVKHKIFNLQLPIAYEYLKIFLHRLVSFLYSFLPLFTVFLKFRLCVKGALFG